MIGPYMLKYNVFLCCILSSEENGLNIMAGIANIEKTAKLEKTALNLKG